MNAEAIVSAIRSFMPALLALVVTGIWGYLVVTGRAVPDSVGNAEFTALAFFFGTRQSESFREAIKVAANGHALTASAPVAPGATVSANVAGDS